MMLLLLPLGCATRGYGAVSIASTNREAVRARILAKTADVDCRSGPFVSEGESADFGIAVQDAISSVPGANALLDASVEVFTYDLLVYRKWCIRVSGWAAVLE